GGGGRRAGEARGGEEREGRLGGAGQAVDRRARPAEETVRAEGSGRAGGGEHRGRAGPRESDRSQARLTGPDDRGDRGRAEGDRRPPRDRARGHRAGQVPRDAVGARAAGGGGRRRRPRQAGGRGAGGGGRRAEGRGRAPVEGGGAL